MIQIIFLSAKNHGIKMVLQIFFVGICGIYLYMYIFFIFISFISFIFKNLDRAKKIQ